MGNLFVYFADSNFVADAILYCCNCMYVFYRTPLFQNLNILFYVLLSECGVAGHSLMMGQPATATSIAPKQYFSNSIPQIEFTDPG